MDVPSDSEELPVYDVDFFVGGGGAFFSLLFVVFVCLL